jgi:hypothetical protein
VSGLNSNGVVEEIIKTSKTTACSNTNTGCGCRAILHSSLLWASQKIHFLLTDAELYCAEV